MLKNKEVVASEQARQYMQIKKFIAQHKDLPEQGSEKWLLQRKRTVGGSEICVLLGQSKYKNEAGLAKEKLNMEFFTPNIATRWGSMFEAVGQRLTELLFDTLLYETGALPGKHRYQSYSPDGLSAVNVAQIKKMIDAGIVSPHPLPDTESLIILWEFKSPFARNPDRTIPTHYLSQPTMGLEVIDMCSHSYFVDVQFRICSREQLPNRTEYNSRFHRSIVGEEYKNYTAGGIIFVYSKNEEFIYETEMNDYGDAGFGYFKSFVLNTHYGYWYADPVLSEPVPHDYYARTLAQFMDFCRVNAMRPVGFLPWKCFYFHALPVFRCPGFQAKVEPLIEDFIGRIFAISEAEDLESEFEKHYPGKLAKKKPKPPAAVTESDLDLAALLLN